MAYRITDHTGEINNAITQKASIFLRLAAEDIVSTSQPMTPKKTGRLRMDVVKQVLGLKGSVVWGKHYAVYQEKKQYRNYTTPGTGPHYAEKSVLKVVDKTSAIARRAGLV